MQLLLALASLLPLQTSAFAPGQPAPDLQIERWLLEPKPPTSTSSGSGTGKNGEPIVTGATQRWSIWHEATIVFHAPLAASLPLLAELADAGSDRALSLVGWTIADDEKVAAEGCKRLGESVRLGVPKAGSPLTALAPELLVLGPSGELVWAGSASQPKEFVAAVGEALSRPRGKPLGAPLAPELATALNDYWNGAWGKARTAADKLAKKPGSGALAADAKRLVTAVDELERELGIAAQEALGKSQMHELVEIEALLVAGLPGATQKHVSDQVKDVPDRALLGVTADEARKWLEVSTRRPLFFPVRSEPVCEHYAHELDLFSKRTSSIAGPQQRVLALLQRWEQRKPR